jgi:predicted transcriptional regulator of viral defense system
MTIRELKRNAKHYPLFKIEDVFKWFPRADRKITINQLSQWVKSGELERIKRGVYKLVDFEIKDSFILAGFIYSPSYISLAAALNYYSIIPDVPFAITSVTTKKTQKFSLPSFGDFYFHHLKPELFFGFQTMRVGEYSYNIALPEKALFDYLYLNQQVISPKGFPREQRFYFAKDFQWQQFQKYSSLVPSHHKRFHLLKDILLKQYGH